jgi:hypothetical protein
MEAQPPKEDLVEERTETVEENGRVTKRVTVTRRSAPPKARKKENVLLILQDAKTGRVEKVVKAANIVTDTGAEYYAERGSAETPTYTFNLGRLALASSYNATEAVTRTLGNLIFTSGTTGIATFDSGYPQTSDADGDNTGSGARVVSYRVTYATSEANFTIKALGIVRAGWSTDPSTAASLRVLLNYLTLSVAQQITKTSSQTLKVFCNHAFTGV